MKIFYIDYENVDGSLSFLHPDPEDEAVLFHSPPSMGKLVKHLGEWIGLGCKMRFVPCSVGTKNALDFILVSEMAARICKDARELTHVIVSADCGYDAAVRYWRAKAIDVRRISPSEQNDDFVKPLPETFGGSITKNESGTYMDGSRIVRPTDTDDSKIVSYPNTDERQIAVMYEPDGPIQSDRDPLVDAKPDLSEMALWITGNKEDAKLLVMAMSEVNQRRQYGNWLSGTHGSETMLNNALYNVMNSSKKWDKQRFSRIYAQAKPYADELIRRFII